MADKYINIRLARLLVETPTSWLIGAIRSDGTYTTISKPENGPAHISADRIKSIIFPISMPWSDQAELRFAEFNLVESNSRNMGSDDYYNAQVEDRGPNGQNWRIELEYVEYEDPLVSRIEHSDNISYAEWEPDDLADAISNRF